MMNVKILSYNSTGFNSFKGDYINSLSLLMDIDFICLQEHFHLKENIIKIQNELSAYNSAIVPASKTNEFISVGRPSGGLCIFWKRSLDNVVTIINHPNSRRVHAIDFDSRYLIVNAYFPVDPKTANFDDFELIKTLQDINWYIDSFPNHLVILVGDLNCDFSRNTRFVNIVREFMLNHNLSTVWSIFPVDFTFSQTQIRNNNEIFSHSCIDHFLINVAQLPNVIDAQVIHTGDNLSVHEPIYLSFKTNHVITESENPNTFAKVPKPVWSKAADEDIINYRAELKQKLDRITLTGGITCNDTKCSDIRHCRDIDSFCQGILNAIDSSVSSNIPSSCRNQSEKVIPGWKDYVKSYQEDAQFWHAIWVSYGKPTNCDIHNIMKKTRNAYHYAVRRIKKNVAKIQQDKMLDSYMEGGSCNLLKELKSQRRNNVVNISTKIDSKTDKVDIANHFGSIYSDLYNTNDSNHEMKTLLDNLNEGVDNNNLCEIDNVTPEIVFQAICSIHKNKSDNIYDWKSDAIINAGDLLTNHITLLLQSFLLHGYVPSDLLVCSLKPIIKDNQGSKSSSANYRAIGISALILKILDLVILIIFGNDLTPSELQFGFQKKNSPTMCTWVVTETINYFNNRDTPVFSCFLDISKAFDLVNFHKLFGKLHSKVSPLFIRLLAYIYMFQVCKVDWNGASSESFNVMNGVRQGAVLSPTLFSIYIDELFSILKHSGYGCHINNYFYGLIGYADDLVLLSPDIFGLQQMLDITNNYLKSIGLKISVDHINPHKSKTKCIAFGYKQDPVSIKLGGTSLPWSDRYVHLGHLLYKDGTLNLDCDMKRKSFIGQFHELRQELKFQEPVVYIKLINIYLSHFYGNNLWNLFNCDSLYTTWNNVIRNLFNLPRCTHRYLLEPVSETPHLMSMLTNRFIKFYNSLYYSVKPIVKNLRIIQEKDMRSTFGMNVYNMCKINNTNDPLTLARNTVEYQPIIDCDLWKVDILKELLNVRKGVLSLDISVTDLNDMIYYISCS